jgi:penicillin-binding protein 1A
MLQLTVEEGTAKNLREVYGFKPAFAAKTGTSQSYSDAWIMGFNQNLVFGVRVGANNPGIHFNSGVYGSSVKLALPVLGGTLNQMQRYGLMRNHLNAGFDIDANYLDCDHFKKDGFFKNALLQFRSKGSTVEKESKRINRKRKFNDLVDKINPFKKD